MIWNYKNCNSLTLRIHRNNKVQQKIEKQLHLKIFKNFKIRI